MSTGADIKAAAVALRDALAGAGIPTSLEPNEVPVPGAWVSVREVPAPEQGTSKGWTLEGRPTSVTAHVYLVAPAGSTLKALDILGGLLDKALDVIDPDGAINTAIALPLQQYPNQPLPAFLVPVDLDL
jgi:hypothetical protein